MLPNKMPQDLEQLIKEHNHEGVLSKQINAFDLFGNMQSEIIATPATIATTGNTDWYVIAPFSGVLVSVDFSGTTALATNDTNYITFTITNLGQAGAGTTVMLSAVAGNTTKATGGVALAVNTKRSLIISTVINATLVGEGDRLLVRAAATGTLANTVTFPTYLLKFK